MRVRSRCNSRARSLVGWLGSLALATASLAGAESVPSAEELERGRAIYNYHCYFCHGYGGDARTLAAQMLQPPPRDFQASDPAQLGTAGMVAAVRDGRPGTAMPAFAGRLSEAEVRAVVGFVRETFVRRKQANTLYHTPENGWAGRQFDSPAADFALGVLDLATPEAALDQRQRLGKRIFLSTCVACHDVGRAAGTTTPWEHRAVSYPRGRYSHREPPADGSTGASPYHLHDRVPAIAGLSEREAAGQRLYQANCAFCHAADGTGRNWIGSFVEPSPRDLTAARVGGLTDAQLITVIGEGLVGTAMPAWRHVLGAEDIAAIVAYLRKAFQTARGDG